ncbi:MAG: class I SAM-dependent RNA methyltransferase [Bacillota bacterium]|nr:class I SAM-dependent RNA methyltransferase [Bacillota bacterium]
MELIATATFGLEAVVRREVEALGYNIIKTEDGKVTFEGDERAIVRSNLWLRSADRVQIKMAEFQAKTFEELFQQTTAIYWERFIPLDGRFTVTCSTVKSQLHHPPSIQSIAKKAIVERMKLAYGFERFKETGADHTVKVTILKDRVTLTMDTTGAGLHKRGYRVSDVEAPIKETLAAALVELSFWNRDRVLVDPCCGSGTIPIEAALIAGNIAPGLNRKFVSEDWKFIDKSLWKEERKNAYDAIISADQCEGRIIARDIDSRAVKAARDNIEEAGVGDYIQLSRGNITEFKPSDRRGVIVTNLPYGMRIGSEEEIRTIYNALKHICAADPSWSVFAITSDKEMEKAMGRRANRRRKLYNGNLETTYYQFHGEKI